MNLQGAGLSGTALSVIGNGISLSMEATEMDLTGDFDVIPMCAIPHVENQSSNTTLASILPKAATALELTVTNNAAPAASGGGGAVELFTC